MEEHYDFLALHGATHAILGSGERVVPQGLLPHDAGTHLVAGRARLGGFRVIGTFPPRSELEEPPLSTDQRWLGVHHGETLTLYDLDNGCRPGFSFQRPTHRSWELSIHPSGEMLALRTADEVQVLLPDGQLLTSARFPRGDRPARLSSYEYLSFSACGEYLWLANVPPDAPDCLLLLRMPTLEVLDRIPVPFDPSNPYDKPNGGWAELSGSIFPAANHLVLNRTAGDSFLGITFHRVKGNKIATHLSEVSIAERWLGFDGEPVSQLAFSADGQRFVGVGKYGYLYEWKWPECRIVASTHEVYLRLGGDDPRTVENIACWSDLVLVNLGRYEGNVQILRAGSFARVGIMPAGLYGVFLPNGLLAQDTEGETLEVGALEVHGEVPVVLELDSAIGWAERVVQRQASGWVDITSQVAWVEPNFDLAPADGP